SFTRKERSDHRFICPETLSLSPLTARRAFEFCESSTTSREAPLDRHITIQRVLAPRHIPHIGGESSTTVYKFAEFCTGCALILERATDIRPLLLSPLASAGAATRLEPL